MEAGAKVQMGGGAETAEEELNVAQSIHKLASFMVGAACVGHIGWT